jgi:hypothetical protein
MTRRIVTYNRVTADGYFSAPDGNLDWVVQEPELDKEGGEQPPRRRHDPVRAPDLRDLRGILAESSRRLADSAGRRTPEIRTLAVWINEATKLVFSRTRKQVTWKNSRLLHALDPPEIEAMKKQPART